MSIFDIENRKTPITYSSCSRLGMKYIDTLAPQYLFQIEVMRTDKNGWKYPTYYDYVRVVFRPSDGYNAEVQYTTDHHSLSNRNWIDVEDPSEELLTMIVDEIKQKYMRND